MFTTTINQEEPVSVRFNRPRVAIVGSGAVGGYYGSRLHECGLYDVRFYMRNEHYDHCKTQGLRVTSPDGDMYIKPSSLQVYNSTSDIGPSDWVIVSIKSTGLDEIPQLIAPMLTANTKVLAIMNGLIDEDLVELLSRKDNNLPCSCVYGGMAFICSTRTEVGHVHHLHYGSLSGGVSALSPHIKVEKALADIECLWAPTKIKFTPVNSLVRGRWEKNAWNLPFSGLCVAMGGITVDKVVGSSRLRILADKIMDETILIANTDLEIRGEGPPLGKHEKERMWYLADNMGSYSPSTILDLLNQKPIEAKYLFSKALLRGSELNLQTPHLETIVSQIEALQEFNQNE